MNPLHIILEMKTNLVILANTEQKTVNPSSTSQESSAPPTTVMFYIVQSRQGSRGMFRMIAFKCISDHRELDAVQF